MVDTQPTVPRVIRGLEIKIQMINYDNNPFGNIILKDGSFVRLVEEACAENIAPGVAGWIARGYLSTENEVNEEIPTVTVIWSSLGKEDSEYDADWAEPESIKHVSLGELMAA